MRARLWLTRVWGEKKLRAMNFSTVDSYSLRYDYRPSVHVARDYFLLSSCFLIQYRVAFRVGEGLKRRMIYLSPYHYAAASRNVTLTHLHRRILTV